MLLRSVRSGVLANVRSAGVRIKKRKYSAPAVTETETTEPKYPPILDHSLQGRFRRNRDDVAQGIARQRTVEEKMIMLNMPRYWGWRSTFLEEPRVNYNALDQMQYITRTHVRDQPGLPFYYDNLITTETLKEKVEKLRGSIEDCLVFEYSSRRRSEELDKSVLEEKDTMSDIMSKAVSEQVHRLLVSNLAPEYPHLLESEMSLDPRVEAFWFAGGIVVPTVVKIWRRHAVQKSSKAVTKMPADFEDYPLDRQFQYVGKPNLQLRHRFPLPEIMPISESENPDFKVPVYKYEPKSIGYSTVRRHGTNIPGFWPGDPNEFGLVSYHKCGHLATRRFDDISDAVKVQAVLGSWSWLLAQVCNLGFSTFNEITYPLTNQMIITNGKWWTFCVYQLNTVLVHSFNNDENPRKNICWMTEPMKLFDKIENDQVHGLNTEVLENLVKFYINAPRERLGVEMKPFLQTGEKLVANIPGDKKRVWLEERFKHLQSVRPRHFPMPEVYNWQDIYLRKFKTRSMDKKRETWEFGVNEMLRKLDYHRPRYIPRAVRGSKYNPRLENTFYPK